MEFTRPYSPRVSAIMRCIRQDLHSDLSLRRVAKQIGLSYSRAITVFRTETGFTMRQYAVWLRLKAAIFAVAKGLSLTDAAHAAGFADSPHFARRFKECFGLPASAILKKNGIRLVYDESDLRLEDGCVTSAVEVDVDRRRECDRVYTIAV